ncbi:copper resistance protein B [Microvirga sp. SRT01]|uniref:Copper resistance protein B n=2 Tax=Sphingomonas longa TaxID=2778730 RepID=A0ABS2D7G7_9SPHN|nr:copper resistance protein B [Microvirga sp. SRT01]MBM6576878.1 copper resistance protein B [Sphingomonas sp. BT552]MBR7709922.1 copper resistance protein B [Microvirga sp. SRT01]
MIWGLALLAVATIGIAPGGVSAGAQDHAMHGMPGMAMPGATAKPAPAKPKPVAKMRAAKPTAKRAARPQLRATAPAPVDHAQMDHSRMDHSGMNHAAAGAATDSMPMDQGAMASPAAKAGTDLPAGDAPAPAVPMPHYADRVWDPAAMARARDVMMREEGGGQTFAQVMLDLAELQVRDGRDGYRWEGEAWFGGDIHRAVVKSEGEGDLGDRLEAAEVQALYARAIGPYFNLQAGVRHDIRPGPARTYATIGVEGLAPYWFEVDAAAFVATTGEVLGRVEGYYDQRLTQRWILQPRAEVNLSVQDVRRRGIGSGITDAELGLRLRYEIRREFAPYVGVSWERRLGDTARFARGAGEDTGGIGVVAGLRAWF